MTPKELQKIGIRPLGSKVFPRRFFIPNVADDVYIPESYDHADLYGLIYDLGHKSGTKYGEETKMKQIRDCIGIVEP